MATATKHEVIADAVLEAIGGVENVKSVTHCATRLRFALNDRDKADKAKVEATRGVITVMESGGQFQVVIGNTVNEVYQAIIRHKGIKAGESVATGGFMARLIDLVTSIFTPFLWVLAGTGLIKAALAVAVAINADFGLTTTYALFYAASDATFQFLPLFLAITAAKKFKANQWVAVAIVGALLYSETIGIDAIGGLTLKAFADSGEALDFFGIPVLMPAYLSAVIPAIFAVYVQSKLEQLLDKFMPEAIKNFINPMIVVGVVVPFTFLVIGPLSALLGDGLAWVVDNLWALSPAVGGALLGAGWQVFVIFGLHWALLPLFMVGLTTVGYSLLTGPLFAAVASQGAAALAVFFKTKNKDLKGVAGPASLSGIVAGITEPAIYGVTLRLKKPFIYGVIGGAVGGSIAAIGGSAADGFVLPSALTVVSTINIGNFGMQLLGTGLAMVIAFSLTFFLGFKDLPATTDEDEAKDAAEVEAGPVTVAAPVAGTVIPLAEVNDKVFSSGALGQGAGVLPASGVITAPVAGELVTVMPHAYGIRTAAGVEVLVHVGIDTVKLDGKHFASKVAQGDTVVRGQQLAQVDLAAVKAAGFDTTTVVLVTNADEADAVAVAATGAVAGEGDLLTVSR
ncbi:beta-glucoside-specific PTS transporter subunit IIABC [Demequina pelophila]|uniref:beta-glucoside-specific PTS transporter subunit IIABC n=1 Tax=Demequina pelophila TaxID=1638984 RepID=UPI000782949E|nr:beta-glucoside-specific PTS transporter subunit IIABC [Demequina pelophila]